MFSLSLPRYGLRFPHRERVLYPFQAEGYTFLMKKRKMEQEVNGCALSSLFCPSRLSVTPYACGMPSVLPATPNTAGEATSLSDDSEKPGLFWLLKVLPSCPPLCWVSCRLLTVLASSTPHVAEFFEKPS